MKIPVWNGIKKTIDANKRVQAATADYEEKHAQYTAFAEVVQQDVYELGKARIAAAQVLEQAVQVIGKAARMGDHNFDDYNVSQADLVKIEQQNAQLTALAGGAAVLSGIFALPVLAGIAIGAEVIGSRAERRANESIEMLRVEAAKIDREMAQLKAIQLRTRELKTTTTKLTESLTQAIRNERGNWFQRIVTFVKRLFIRKKETNEHIYQVVLIAKALSAAIDEPIDSIGRR